MEETRGKTGSSRLRIIESDSESELDDINELSMSMKHVGLDDESDTGSDDGDIEQGSESDEQNVARQPPRGRRVQRLDDFLWSSSDEETDGSGWTSSSSTRKKPEKAAEETPTKFQAKHYDSNFSSSSSRNFASSSSGKKASQPKSGSKRLPPESTPLRPQLKSSDSELSLSGSLSSSLSGFSSSDDDSYVVSSDVMKKSSKKKKDYSWSFNKTQRVYTLGGNDKLPAFSIPSDLYSQLYDFQKEGVAWMAGLHVPKIGGILGDDMGMVSKRQDTKNSNAFDTL